MQPNIIWDEFLKIAKEEAGSQVVETWFKAVVLEEINTEKAEITLKMPNNFVCNWIQEHYLPLVKNNLTRLLQLDTITVTCIAPQPARVTVENPETNSEQEAPLTTPFTATPARIDRSEQVRRPQPSNPSKQYRPAMRAISPGALATPEQLMPAQKMTTLNSSYLFDSFVVGPSNSLAHGAAYAVSQNVGKVYNPLFIYGGTGLGKTHLLHAIGNEAKRLNPSLKVRYETSDQFMHSFIRSIRFDRAHQFREKYRQIDLFLIDDVQFFSNKEQTQETFFHIFNYLHEQNKQIVLSSDTFPEEIKGLQSRLTSRMEWGLVADMQTPDLETKMAILSKKSELHGITLSSDVSTFIASRVRSNIRQLEGALIRVDAFASLTGQKISLELAKRVLLQFNTDNKREPIDLAEVVQVISKHYGITVGEAKSKKRNQTITLVRQISCYFMKKLTSHSLQAIGGFFGGRNHSTVIHAISKIEQQIAGDARFKQKINTLESEILSR